MHFVAITQLTMRILTNDQWVVRSCYLVEHNKLINIIMSIASVLLKCQWSKQPSNALFTEGDEQQ